MQKFCDLHTHSHYSDGTWAPSQLIDEAVRVGLSAIALCDHNTTLGLNEFLESANGSGVSAIAGIEISTDYYDDEVHVVGLFLPQGKFTLVQDFVNPMVERKIKSSQQLIQNLNDAGYKLDYDELVKSCKGNFNRAHVAAKMVELGYVESISHAFKTILSPSQGFYQSAKRIDSFEAVEFLSSIGAVPVLAHPFLSLSEQRIHQYVKGAKPLGLCAMETMYSTYDEQTQKLAKQIAREYGILESGGSDFHADNKPHIKLGIGCGNLKTPYQFAIDLQKKAK